MILLIMPSYLDCLKWCLLNIKISYPWFFINLDSFPVYKTMPMIHSVLAREEPLRSRLLFVKVRFRSAMVGCSTDPRKLYRFLFGGSKCITDSLKSSLISTKRLVSSPYEVPISLYKALTLPLDLRVLSPSS